MRHEFTVYDHDAAFFEYIPIGPFRTDKAARVAYLYIVQGDASELFICLCKAGVDKRANFHFARKRFVLWRRKPSVKIKKS
ncbi:hypothetical protein FACS1894187_17760 [Synergistales bacterium]|nr:hypothetical protein FACS1894187_17760 [Synergistales bacterium]